MSYLGTPMHTIAVALYRVFDDPNDPYPDDVPATQDNYDLAEIIVQALQADGWRFTRDG